jgi:hypothetical protein
MNFREKYNTFESMRRYGGALTRYLAQAWMVADPVNRHTLERAFPNYLQKYGPGSPFYTENPYD